MLVPYQCPSGNLFAKALAAKNSKYRKTRDYLATLFLSFRQTRLSFFPFRCTDRRNSARLSYDHRPREQVPEHHPAITAETLSRGDTCRRVSYTHDDDQGADDIPNGRDTFTPLPAGVTKKQTKFNWRLWKILTEKIWSIILILDHDHPFMSLSGLHTLACIVPSAPSAFPRRPSKAYVFSHMVCCDHGLHCLDDHFSQHFLKCPILINTSFRWLRADCHNSSH